MVLLEARESSGMRVLAHLANFKEVNKFVQLYLKDRLTRTKRQLRGTGKKPDVPEKLIRKRMDGSTLYCTPKKFDPLSSMIFRATKAKLITAEKLWKEELRRTKKS